jgi:alkylhydroperoxidase family enzyme
MPEEDFDLRLASVLEPYKKRMGFLPNALKLYAYRPEIAETLWKLNSNVMRDPSSTLDQLLKRKLAAVACATNGCAYCTAHSCAMLKKSMGTGGEGWGVSEEELQDIITGAYEPKNEMERVCFDYVRSASEDATSVPDEVLQRLRQHLSPPQIVELACVVGFWKFYNTVHDSLHIPVESTLLRDTGYVDL